MKIYSRIIKKKGEERNAVMTNKKIQRILMIILLVQQAVRI
jgi:hypothetical protein